MPEKKMSGYVKVSICHKISGQVGIFLFKYALIKAKKNKNICSDYKK